MASTNDRSAGTIARTASTTSATRDVEVDPAAAWSRATSTSVMITSDMARAEVAICSSSVRVSGSSTPRSRARSAAPWIAVSGVRSSWASSEVSRCSDRMAIATRSSRPSIVAPSCASSLSGPVRSNRCVRSCSLQSVARLAICATGFSAWVVTRLAIAAEMAITSRPIPTVAINAYISDRSYAVVSWLTTTTPDCPARVVNGTPRRRRSSLALTLRTSDVVARSSAASRPSSSIAPATSRPWSS